MEAKLEELKSEPKTDDVKPYLKYVFLEEGSNKTDNINSSLSIREEQRIIEVLKENKKATTYVLSDLKSISTSYSKHKIMIDENFKHVAQPRLNSIMKEVVRK